MSEWRLSSPDGGTSYPLPTTMVFVGSSECDVNIEYEGIDKRHAVITFDHYQNKFKIKDLGSAFGTYINEKRIPDQTYITIERGDSIKLGNDSKPLQIEQVSSRTFKMPQSQSLDTISSHNSNNSSDEQAHTPLSRSSSRPKWEQRPSLAECQGCIKEQDLHHTCGANSDLETDPIHHTHEVDGVAHRSPALSPLDLNTQSNSRQSGSPTPMHREKVPIVYRDYHPHHQNTHQVEEHMPLDPILNTHVNKHQDRRHLMSKMSSDHQQTTFSPQLRRAVEVIHADANFNGTAALRGTPLYGQPTWWGETDADEHNKQLLKDIQKEMEQEKVHKSAVADAVTSAVAGPRRSPTRQTNNTVSDVETGADTSKGLSFTVDLEDSLEEKEVLTELPLPAAGEKLSNFLPENLRKSFRERRERLSLSAEKNNQNTVTDKNSPSNARRSKSPTRTKSPARKSPQTKVQSSTKQSLNSADDNPSMFLINKMFYTPPGKGQDHSTKVKDTDEETEYSMYAEARSLNRSSTMPELIHSSADPTSNPHMMKSRTFDDGDKVSESGTYTIDEDNKELEKAREDIDKIFGVTSSPGDPAAEPIRSASLEIKEDARDQNRSLRAEHGSSKTEDTYIESSTGNKADGDSIYSSEEILRPKAVESPVEQQDKHSTEQDTVLGKPPISPPLRTRSPERQSSPGLRRSVGRRLPDVPVSPTGEDLRQSTEVHIGRSNTMPRRKKEVSEFSKERILQELGIGDTPVIEKERPKLVEELLTSRTYHRDNDPIVVNKTNFFDKIISSGAVLSPEQSKSPPQYSAVSADKNRQSQVGRASVDSVNTDVLLQSTDEFMKAIHSFSADNSEVSSTTPAAQNNTRNTSRQSNSLSKSTADRLNNNVSKSRDGTSSLPTPKTTTTKKDGTPTTRRSVADSVTARLSGAKRSQVADLKSRDSDSNEGSLESLNNTKNQSVSAAKPGGLSNARPNRTFELRRARTGSIDSDTSTVNTPRTNGARASVRSSRSNNNTEVSLGAKIVQKSRENGATDNRPTPLKRNDGGRYSMRVTGTSKTTTPSTKPSSAKPTSSTTGKKMTPRNSSNSLIAKAEREKEAEKEKEKAAWDRRRTYDPRKAVQQKDGSKSSNGKITARKSIKSYPQCSPVNDHRHRIKPRSGKPAFEVDLPVVQAKAKKSDSRGGTPSSADEAPISNRPRANSYSGENASIISNAPTTASSQYNGAADTRHSADVFQPMESDTLKLNLDKEEDMEGSGHELEIAKLSHNLAKDLEMLSMDDGEEYMNRYDSHNNNNNSKSNGREPICETSPDTEELVESMFAVSQQSQQKSAFCSYRSAASVTPEMASPALSPMRKKLSSSQNLENHRSPSAVDHSYNNLVLTSIQQLSGKLHTYTSNTVGRLREKGVSVSASPSPTEELEDMPASSELASILKTLKRVEQNVKLMDKALFTSVPQSDFSTVSNNEHEHYLAEIKRIRNEIAGFRPIDTTTKPAANITKVPPKVASKPTNNKPRTTGGNTAGKTNTTSYKRAVYY